MATGINPSAFSDLLRDAVEKPGIISAAYSQFHNYSLGNVLLAAFQCSARAIPLGPLRTFNRWRELGRHVKKGEKALTLCQPVTFKKERPDGEGEEVLLRFTFRNAWFVLSQTDGQTVEPEPLPTWDAARALQSLDVTEEPFACIDGNVMGYARARTIAVSPVNPHPHKTRFHELAHVLMGHTAQAEQRDEESVSRSLAEVEAECVALLCLEALGLPGSAFCRGYIQRWNESGDPIPERSAQRILRAADQILRAGRTAAEGVAQ